MKFKIRLWLATGLLLGSFAYGQQHGSSAPKPCGEGQRRQFDFWLGSWEVSWPASPHGAAGFGRENVQRILNNCVVQENFTEETASPARAMSVSAYIPERGQWRQTRMDNQGHYAEFSGESKNDEVVLSRDAEVDGKKVVQRVVWRNIKPMEFDWSWEQSEDGGKTWQVLWPMHFVRHKQ